VFDDLNWGSKRKDTQSLTETFGSSFNELWNQPAGSSREGRLGQLYYQRLRDTSHGKELISHQGDDEIIDAYATFQNETNKDGLLFSNDRDFIENAHSTLSPFSNCRRRRSMASGGAKAEWHGTMRRSALIAEVRSYSPSSSAISTSSERTKDSSSST
jgi:hypothetical protein